MARHGINRPRSTDLELVEDHVPETLIVDNTNVDVRGELLPGDPGIHWFVAVVVVARSKKLLPEVVNCGIFFREPMAAVG